MAKKVWSISTTLRNPDRIRNFIVTAKEIEGKVWNNETQKEYQIRLIKNRFYGSESTQFLNGLSRENKDIIKNLNRSITFEEAKNIFYEKDYTTPAMRGRTSLSPLRKMGFVIIDDNKVKVTKLGNKFLKEDSDFGDILFKVFLKWQYPNPNSRSFKDGYNIRPFIGTMHLINRVNKKWEELGHKPVGLSRDEFAIFALSLTNYNDIDEWVQKLILFRIECRNKSNYQEKKEFTNNYIDTFLSSYTNKDDIYDYTDNTIRYFRLTRYFHLRGGGFYFDLEPRREVEINKILDKWDGSVQEFENKKEYREYLSDTTKPSLPFEDLEDMKLIVLKLKKEIRELNKKLDKKTIDFKEFTELDKLKEQIDRLRNLRKELNLQIEKNKFSKIDHIHEVIDKLDNIRNQKMKPSVALEKWATTALNILNDALKVKPNYPVGDDNEPTFTAPGNQPDIECYYNKFNLICEVTLLKNRGQWFNEGQPVMRHLRDFENNSDKDENYALFIAPSIHRDTINTFWHSCKYEYEGKKQKIIPIRIKELKKLLKLVIHLKENNREFKHDYLKTLFDNIYNSIFEIDSSQDWFDRINKEISNWNDSLRVN